MKPNQTKQEDKTKKPIDVTTAIEIPARRVLEGLGLLGVLPMATS